VRLNGAWKQVNDLPEGLAYGATFTTDDGLLVVGGEGGDRKPRADSFLLSWDGEKVNFVD
jgi:N-acetylneuraminate epimerase